MDRSPAIKVATMLIFNLRRRPLCREVLAEVMGTFVLMVFGMGATAQHVLSRGEMSSIPAVIFGWTAGVTMGIYVSGGVSGGHINPAVSVAMGVLGRLPWRKVPFYIAAQYLGSFWASCVIYFVYYDALGKFDGGVRQVLGVNATAGIWATYPQPYISAWTGLGDQVCSTAVLMLCVLAIIDQRNLAPDKGLFPISVGLLVGGLCLAFSFNCGCAMNPARDLMPRLFTAMAGWGLEPFSIRGYNWFWINVVGPHVGAVVGALLYELFIEFHWPLPESDDQPVGDAKEIREPLVGEMELCGNSFQQVDDKVSGQGSQPEKEPLKSRV